MSCEITSIICSWFYTWRTQDIAGEAEVQVSWSTIQWLVFWNKTIQVQICSVSTGINPSLLDCNSFVTVKQCWMCGCVKCQSIYDRLCLESIAVNSKCQSSLSIPLCGVLCRKVHYHYFWRVHFNCTGCTQSCWNISRD